MRPTTLLLALVATLVAPLVSAQSTYSGTECTTESPGVLDCTVLLHEIGPNGPFHALPERIPDNGAALKVGDTLKLHVENLGNNTHNPSVCGDANPPADTCHDIWAFTQSIPAHGTKDITVE